MVAPRDLPALRAERGPHRVVYGCVARDDSMVRRRGAAAAGDAAFDVAHYRAEPHLYDPVFHETVAPYTTVPPPPRPTPRERVRREGGREGGRESEKGEGGLYGRCINQYGRCINLYRSAVRADGGVVCA